MKPINVFVALLITALLTSVVIVSGCAGSDLTTDKTVPTAVPAGFMINVTGGTKSPVTVTLADLKAIPSVRKDVYYCDACVKNDDKTPYYGPPAVKVLEKAGLPQGNYTLRVSSPNGISINYTREQVENSIIALKKKEIELGDSPENGITFVYAEGDSLEWVTLPAKMEIL